MSEPKEPNRLNQILEEASERVAKWPDWKKSAELREIDRHEMCCKHCFDEGYQKAMAELGEPSSAPPAAQLEFEKLPVRVQAVKVPMREYADAPYVFECVPNWLREAIDCGRIRAEFRSEDYYYFVIKTRNGEVSASPGEWIIRGVQGELYPCSSAIFAQTYKAVEAGAAQEVSPVGSVQEIRPRPDDPSCHVCGAQMVVKEWECLSCKTTTGVEEVSPPSPEPKSLWLWPIEEIKSAMRQFQAKHPGKMPSEIERAGGVTR